MENKKIPQGWRKTELGVFVSVQGGCAFKSEDFCDSGIPIIRISNIKKDGSVDLNGSIFCQYSSDLARYEVRRGDILIAMSGATTGKVGKYKSNLPAYLNQRVGRFKVKDHLNVENDFIHQITSTDQFINSVLIDAAGGAQPNISNQQIEAFEVLLPPLSEQQKITTILSSVDNVIEKTRAKIDKLKHLKTGMMQELLTKGIGHTEFKDTPVGRIPKAWGVATLGSLLKEKPQYGANASATPYIKGSPRYLRITDILDDGSLDQSSPVGICPDESNGYYLKKDDLVIARTGNTVGKSYIHTGDFDLVYAGYLIKFVADKKRVFPRFLFWITQSKSYQDWLESMMRVGAQPNINAAEYSSMLIAVPSLEEQADINAALDGVQSRIRISEHKNKQMSNLKKSLMQDLLTGKVRVKLTNSAAI